MGTMTERVEKIEDILNKYYESEDSFEQTEFAIDIIQNHLGWLMKEAKSVSRMEERVTIAEHENQILYGRLNNIIALAEEEVK